MFGIESAHAARYAGLELCFELAPTACAVGYRYDRQLRWLGDLQNVETLGPQRKLWVNGIKNDKARKAGGI